MVWNLFHFQIEFIPWSQWNVVSLLNYRNIKIRMYYHLIRLSFYILHKCRIFYSIWQERSAYKSMCTYARLPFTIKQERGVARAGREIDSFRSRPFSAHSGSSLSRPRVCGNVRSICTVVRRHGRGSFGLRGNAPTRRDDSSCWSPVTGIVACRWLIVMAMSVPAGIFQF